MNTNADRGATISKHHWYAVRCCCTPTEIFGFLRLEDDTACRTILDRYGGVHKLELKTSCTPRYDEDGHHLERELAIYSDDRDLEFWRTIPNFMEVQHS